MKIPVDFDPPPLSSSRRLHLVFVRCVAANKPRECHGDEGEGEARASERDGEGGERPKATRGHKTLLYI